MLEGFAGRIELLIKNLGRDGIIRRKVKVSGTDYDPTFTITDTPAIIVVADFEEHESLGSPIQAGDKKILLSYKNDITKQDKIVDGAIEYSIMSLTIIKPGKEVFLYSVHARL